LVFLKLKDRRITKARKEEKKKRRKADRKVGAQGSKGYLAGKVGIAKGTTFQADGGASRPFPSAASF